MKLPAPSFIQDVGIKEGICHVILKTTSDYQELF